MHNSVTLTDLEIQTEKSPCVIIMQCMYNNIRTNGSLCTSIVHYHNIMKLLTATIIIMHDKLQLAIYFTQCMGILLRIPLHAWDTNSFQFDLAIYTEHGIVCVSTCLNFAAAVYSSLSVAKHN